DAARHPRVPVRRDRHDAEPGRRCDCRLHRCHARRPGQYRRGVRPRASAAAHDGARLARAAGTGRRLRARRPPRRGRGAAGERLVMTFPTPLGGLVALAALLPLAAALVSRARAEVVRRRLQLPPPERASVLRPLLGTAAIALLGLAAAQPALTRATHPRSRT